MTIHPLDAAIVIAYLGTILMLGAWLGRGQKDTLEYLLGNRSLPTWALLLSIVATETSAVTFLSIPGATYVPNGNMGYLQLAFGYIVGRFLVIGVLLPKYFEGQPFTAYEVLERRFGITSRRVTSALFLVTRNLGDALRLYLTALALEQAIGLNLTACIVVMGVVTILYTLFGGVKSVVWNDCLQFFIYILGAVVALGVIVYRLPGGWDQLLEFGRDTGRFRVLDFDLTWTKPSITFWSGLVGGMFLTAATHGTDQMMVQRYLSSHSQRSATWALGLSGFIVCAQFALFLLIGIGLACFYEVYPLDTPFGPQDRDKVFAHFIVNYLGRGVVGLTLAAIFAATLSSSLNSSAASLIYDIYLPLAKHEPSADKKMWLSRVGTVAFGAIQIIVALGSYQLGANQSTVDSVLKIAGFALGPMLGLYFLAVFAKRVQQRAALIGFVVGVVGISYIALETSLSWPWYAAVGSMITFLAGLITSLVTTNSSAKEVPV